MHTLINPPSNLYKYYRYDNALNEKRFSGEVFLATPFDFNDPCDCQRDVANNAADREGKKGEGWVLGKLEELGYSRKESLEMSKSLLREDKFKYDVYKKQLEKVGILCLTRNAADVLMWGYYANNDGYCIEYDTKKIVHKLVIGYINKLDYATSRRLFQKWKYCEDPQKRTPALSSEQLASANVFSDKDIPLISNTYIKEQEDKGKVVNFIKNVYHKRIAGQDIDYKVGPDGSPSNLFFDRDDSSSVSKYYKKTDSWNHEEEFRIVASLGGRFVINLGKDAIKNIYLGCNMKNEKVIELAYLAHTLGLNVGFYKMKRLKNCGLQAVRLDLRKCTTTFQEADVYLKERCKLYW